MKFMGAVNILKAAELQKSDLLMWEWNATLTHFCPKNCLPKKRWWNKYLYMFFATFGEWG